MKNTLLFSDLAVERPTGSKNDEKVAELLCREAEGQGLKVIKLSFETKLWNKKYSFAENGSRKVELYPGPFSGAFSGMAKVALCNNWNDVRNNSDSIVVLRKGMCGEMLMPVNFPVYFPPEHDEKYNIIKEVNPKCIITESGKTNFEDGNLQFAYAYKDSDEFFEGQTEAYVEINSECSIESTSQPFFEKKGEKDSVILVCAHMDSKYATPGALDNAAGVFSLYRLFEKLKDEKTGSTIHFVPFNGEENYGIPGQLKYLDYIKEKELPIVSVFNIDSPGFLGSQNAVSFYNIDLTRQEQLLAGTKHLQKCKEWYAGDHTIFINRKIP